MADDPSKNLPAVDAMQELWSVVDPLMGGTKAMRAAGESLLPKWPKEDDKPYRDRLNRSTLLPAYSETVANMVGRVFAEPITIGEDVPPQIAEYLQDIDQQGNNLDVWAPGVFTPGLAHGLCHALIDYPSTVGPDGKPIVANRADEIRLGVRPYAVLVMPQQLIGWRYTVVRGAPVLTQVRYWESVDEEEGEFGSTTIKQIRVLEIGAWSVWRESTGANGTKEWIKVGEGATSLDKIPFETFYTKRTGVMTAVPPLLELAYMNIKHWQSQSDQDNILHVARVPLLAISGIDDDSYELVIGTSNATKLPTNGKMEYVEHSGKAIEAGRQSLQDLVDDMRLAGAKLLQKEKQVTKTATQAESEEAQEMSALQRYAGQFEDFLDRVIQLFADYMQEPEGGHVKVNGNFDIDYAPEVTLPLLLNMANSGKLSDETLFSEVKRRGVLSDDLEWKVEKQRIDDQGPALGTLTDPLTPPATNQPPAAE